MRPYVSMLVGRCAGDRSAKRLRLLAEASLQHCLLAAAAAAEEEQQQQERAAEQLFHCQHDRTGGSPAAKHTGLWAMPVTPRADAEADLLQRAAADAVRLAEEKCQVRVGAARLTRANTCKDCMSWQQHGHRNRQWGCQMRTVTALTCVHCAASRLQPRRPGAQSRTPGMPRTCRATLEHSARTTSPPATCPAAACMPRR